MEDADDHVRWARVARLASDLGDVTAVRSDADLRTARSAMCEQRAAGQSRQVLSAHALAAVAEAVRRATGYVCSEREILAGAAMAEGHAVHLEDDGVNAIISALPAYVAAASGMATHVVAADEHLAARSFRQTKAVFALLGVASSMAPSEAASLEDHQRAFDAEVTFGSYLQMAYQYLGNHLAQHRRDLVRWAPELAVVDQVDAVLVDHADDPLVIRGPIDQDAERFSKLAVAAAEVRRGADYDIDTMTGRISWSPSGLQRVAARLQTESLEGLRGAVTCRYLDDAVRARCWYHRGKDYAVERGRVIVRPAGTSKLAEDPRLRSGVLQAIEAREGLSISPELVLLARITVRDYFRLYDRLAGLSGEAARAAGPLEQMYQLKVVSLTGGRSTSVNHADVLFDQGDARLAALVGDAVARHRSGQPVVVAARSDEDARLAIQMLKKAGVGQPVLLTGGGKEADSSFAEAGRNGAITVLGPRVAHGYDIPVEVGGSGDASADARYGLAVLVAGRSRSWRSDHWLQGLAGRRGDPGESQFYLSAHDPLLAGLQSQVISWIPATIRRKADGTPVSAAATGAIAEAQRKAEDADFARQLERLAFEDVESAQRLDIYSIRDLIVLGHDAKDYVSSLMDEIAESYARLYQDAGRLLKRLARIYPSELSEEDLTAALADAQPGRIDAIIKADLHSAYRFREEFVGSQPLRDMERRIALAVLGNNWRQQLLELESMRIAIGFRQRPADLLLEYKARAAQMYSALRQRVAEDTLGYLFHSSPPLGS